MNRHRKKKEYFVSQSFFSANGYKVNKMEKPVESEDRTRQSLALIFVYNTQNQQGFASSPQDDK